MTIAVLYWRDETHYSRPIDHPDVQEWRDEIKRQLSEYGHSPYRIEYIKEGSP